jgi:tRNA1Val (adenine37-N6)-methyltransferase
LRDHHGSANANHNNTTYSTLSIKMQYTEDSILRDGIRILQPERGYRFALDAVLLATFVKTQPTDSILEIGAGSGVVSILIASTHPYQSLAAVEIQEELAELCRKNFEINQLKNAVVYHEDVKNISPLFSNESIDLICCNPPYRKVGTGRLNPSTQKAIARHEIKMKLEDVFECSNRFLKPDGHLTLILPTFRQKDFLLLVERYNLNRMEHRYVHSFENEPPTFFLTTLGKKEEPVVELQPLVIYEKPGEYTHDMNRLLFHGSPAQ